MYLGFFCLNFSNKLFIIFILYVVPKVQICFMEVNMAKKVFIDPGHGGNDNGASGVNNLL